MTVTIGRRELLAAWPLVARAAAGQGVAHRYAGDGNRAGTPFNQKGLTKPYDCGEISPPGND